VIGGSVGDRRFFGDRRFCRQQEVLSVTGGSVGDRRFC